ncbi:MAG: DUF1641 domain-containing protein [Acidimicrobiales bacterium]|jgi:hypothetical protein
MAATEIAPPRRPADVVLERLNDPGVAASLLTILDHVDLLATLATSLSELLQRGDTIIESVTSGVGELAAAAKARPDLQLPSPAELSELARELSAATPTLTKVLSSHMVNEQTISVLSLVAESAVEGAERVRADRASITGLRGVLKAVRDPDVGRGLGFVVEIVKALGRRLRAG